MKKLNTKLQIMKMKVKYKMKLKLIKWNIVKMMESFVLDYKAVNKIIPPINK